MHGLRFRNIVLFAVPFVCVSVPGLTGGKMSSSEVESKIDLLDSAAQVCNHVCGKTTSATAVLRSTPRKLIVAYVVQF